MTNEQVISKLMNFSKTGPMMQAFIMEGLRTYAEQVKAADLSHMEGGFINPEVWKNCAIEYLQEIEKR